MLEPKTSTSSTTRATTTLRGLSEDDEAFLRAILSNQVSVSTTTPSSSEANPAALLALLLKQQGIEPTTPAIKLREQLQLSVSNLPCVMFSEILRLYDLLKMSIFFDQSLGLLAQPDATTSRPTTTSSSVNTARQVVTSRPTARPRPTLQTTTWTPSSTYPPPLFGGSGSSAGSGLVTATRAIGRFLGAAISVNILFS